MRDCSFDLECLFVYTSPPAHPSNMHPGLFLLHLLSSTSQLLVCCYALAICTLRSRSRPVTVGVSEVTTAFWLVSFGVLQMEILKMSKSYKELRQWSEDSDNDTAGVESCLLSSKLGIIRFSQTVCMYVFLLLFNLFCLLFCIFCSIPFLSIFWKFQSLGHIEYLPPFHNSERGSKVVHKK